MRTSPGRGSATERRPRLAARQLAAELGRLQQRQAEPSRPPPTLTVAPAQRSGSASWLDDEVDEVVDVQHVAHLLARAAVADVGQRAGRGGATSIQWVKTPWSTLPICHGPAITPQRLTTVRTPNVSAYSADEQLGRELRRAVERARALEREVLADAGGRHARQRLLGGELEARVCLLDADATRSARDGVDAARREEDHLRAVAARAARGSCRRRPGSSGRRSRAPPSTPASTDGSAEHSTIASTAPDRRAGRRACRTSPCTNCDAGRAQARQVQLASRGGRGCRARRPHRVPARASATARFAPTNPAPPVTRIRMRVSTLSERGSDVLLRATPTSLRSIRAAPSRHRSAHGRRHRIALRRA